MADLETVHATIDHTGITGVGGSSGGERVVVNRTGQGANLTTGSTSFVDMDGTNLTASVTTPAAGKRYQLALQLRFSNNVAAIGCFDITLDGTRLVSASSTGSGMRLISAPANSSMECSIVFVTDVLAAGAHTFKPQWRTNTGTLTANQGTGDLIQFSVVEL